MRKNDGRIGAEGEREWENGEYWLLGKRKVERVEVQEVGILGNSWELQWERRNVHVYLI